MNSTVTNYASAVSDVVDLIERGNDTPVTAISKVACAMDLTDDQVTRVCQLYNRAQQLGDRLGEPKSTTKFAAVAGIVDPDLVIAAVRARREGQHINNKVAAIADLPSDLFDSPGIGLSSDGSRKVGRIAEVVSPSQKIDRFAGLYHGMSRLDAGSHLRELNEKLAGLYADIREKVSAADSAISNAVKTVENDALRCFDVDDRIQCVKHACLALSKAGLASAFIGLRIDSVLDTIPTHKHAAFEDAALEPPKVFTPLYLKYAAMAEALETIFSDLQATLPSKSAACAEARERLTLIKSSLTNSGVYNREIIAGRGTLADRQSEHIGKVGGFFSSFLGGRLAGSANNANQGGMNQATERFKLALGNPQHEAALLSIRSRAALQQLIKDDPIISKEDPNTVATAFNELAAYTPHAMQSQAVLRSALRQYLMNNTSASDLQAIRALERSASRPVV